MQILFVILYFILGIIQILAIIKGIQHYFDVWTFVAALVAMVLSYIPFIGGIAGIIGAKYGWNWEWWQAIMLFMWQPVIYMGFMGAFNIASILQRLFCHNKEKQNNYIAVEATPIKNEESFKEHIPDAQKDRNIFIRMFYGELSLPVTYWAFGVMGSFVWNMIFNFILYLFETRVDIAVIFIKNFGLPGYKILFVTLSLLCAAYSIMSFIGQWRSASKYAGPAVWAIAVKILVVIGWIMIVSSSLYIVELLKLK